MTFFIALAALVCASGLASAEPLCQVSALRGTGTVERAGVRSALTAGAELSVGDVITTDAATRVRLRFADGSEVRLGENAQLRIEFAKFDPAAGTRNILLRLPMGLLRALAAKFPQNTGSSFEIHTGVAYSAVRGTEWIVDAGSAETRVYVLEGRVAVGADFPTDQFPKLVEAGRWVLVSRKAGIGAIQVSPPAALDTLIDQTEAALTTGAPGTEVAEAAEALTDTVATGGVVSAATDTVDAATDAVSAATGAVTDLTVDAVDQTTSTVSAATSAVSATTSAVTSAIADTVNAVTGGGSASSGSSGSSSGSGSSGSGSGGSSSGSSGSGSSGSSSGSSSGGSSSSGGGTSSGGSSSGSDGSSGSSTGSGKSSLGSVKDAVGKTLGGLL